jgi:hypothetical protein
MGQYYRYRLPPGSHHLELSMSNANIKSTDIELKTRAGEIRYISIQSELRLDQSSAGYTPYRRRFSLQLMEKNQAIDEISDCCTTPIKQALSSENEAADKPERQGFSPDMTENPFGH